MRTLAINALILLAGLVALELIFGSWIRDNRIQHLNLITDQAYIHDVSSLYDNGGRPVEYRRDVYGLRGDYDSPNQIGILTVGGSTTDQKYVSEGETWQDVLRDHFVADGKSISVANAGVDGHSTVGHLRSFEWWFPSIPGLSPRYVLFYLGINDVHIESQRKYDELASRDEAIGAMESLRDRSGLYYGYRTLRAMFRTERRKAGHQRVDFERVVWVDAPIRQNHAARSAGRRLAYATRLARLAELTRSLGAEPIFVTQLLVSSREVDGTVVGTQGTDSNGVDVYIITGLFNQTTMDSCRALRAICVDLAADLRPDFTDRDFYDFSHTTPSGAAKIGAYLYRSLRDELEF
jgi:lysophospholipase L1-like esterase